MGPVRPAIAAVRGYALGGGCEPMLAADFRFTGRSAVFGLPEITLGIMPGSGGPQRLPRIVGPARFRRPGAAEGNFLRPLTEWPDRGSLD